MWRERASRAHHVARAGLAHPRRGAPYPEEVALVADVGDVLHRCAPKCPAVPRRRWSPSRVAPFVPAHLKRGDDRRLAAARLADERDKFSNT